MERDQIGMIVARNIEAAIARKGLNPSEVARRAKLNPTGVYDIIKGKSLHPRLDTIHKIAVDGLGISMSELFEDPSEGEVDQELVDLISQMSAAERERFVRMARAYLDESSPLGSDADPA